MFLHSGLGDLKQAKEVMTSLFWKVADYVDVAPSLIKTGGCFGCVDKQVLMLSLFLLLVVVAVVVNV